MAPTPPRRKVHGVPQMPRNSTEDPFRRLTIPDPGLLAVIAGIDDRRLDMPRLDERTESLLRIGALIALDAPPSSYRTAVAAGYDVDAALEQDEPPDREVARRSARPADARLTRRERRWTRRSRSAAHARATASGS